MLTAARSSSRIEWIDAGRGLAIALVVAHHAIGACAREGMAVDGWVYLSELVRTLRMPFFFALAGLLAGRWVAPGASWRRLFDTKLLVLAWVYVIWIFLRAAWFAVVMPSERESPAVDVLLTRLVLPEGGWFLLTLALFFVLARSTAHSRPLP